MSGDIKSIHNQIRKGREYRAALVASHTKHVVASQLRAIRKARGMTQAQMEEDYGLDQSWISQNENPNKGNPTLGTLVQFAEAYDVAVLVRFVDFNTFSKFAARIAADELAIEPYSENLILEPDPIDIQRVEADEGECASMLAELQWSARLRYDMDEIAMCPDCRATQAQGHMKTCRVSKALASHKPAPEVKPDVYYVPISAPTAEQLEQDWSAPVEFRLLRVDGKQLRFEARTPTPVPSESAALDLIEYLESNLALDILEGFGEMDEADAEKEDTYILSAGDIKQTVEHVIDVALNGPLALGKPAPSESARASGEQATPCKITDYDGMYICTEHNKCWGALPPADCDEPCVGWADPAKPSVPLAHDFSDPHFRKAYKWAAVKNQVAFQIRATRKQRGISQEEMAEALGTAQSAISRLESPDYGKMTIETLLKISDLFETGIWIEFLAYDDFLKRKRSADEGCLVPRQCV